jgi:hypothetical protein
VWAAPGCSQSAGTVSCNAGDLAVGGSVTFNIVVRPASAGSITNTAVVASAQPDGAPANNTSAAAIR